MKDYFSIILNTTIYGSEQKGLSYNITIRRDDFIMEEIIISIETVNAAFEEEPEREVARILRDLASKLENGQRPEFLRDINGNKVGKVEYR